MTLSLLNLLDLLFALHAVNNGGVELNPLLYAHGFGGITEIIITWTIPALWLAGNREVKT